MKKQNKKSKTSIRARLFGTWKRALVSFACFVAVIFLVYIVGCFVWVEALKYNQALNYTGVDSIRAHIVRAIDNLGRPAPVEARTGDVYFPSAKLYLPAAAAEASEKGYKYDWIPEQKVLVVVDLSVLEREVSKLYNAQDFDTLFREVPSVQACSRGVAVVPPGQDFEGYVEKATISPGDGKQYRLFADAGCPAGVAVARVLEGLRSY